MLGLKRGTVSLFPHEIEWENEAKTTIQKLRGICENVICDIAHVGSTSVKTIAAKPIIDIAVAVEDFEEFLKYEKELRDNGFYYRPDANISSQLLFACGSMYDGSGDLQTHFIHVVKSGSRQWMDYINFRDYLNNNPCVAHEYEQLKLNLAEKFSCDSGRERYLAGKCEFIEKTLRDAIVRPFLGKTVRIVMDRPIGTPHPKHPEILYPINYGYIPEVFGGDMEELDVYLVGVDEPCVEYTAKIIGIVYRKNDVEDKLVAAPEGMEFTAEEIEKLIHFQEQFYDSHVEIM